MEDTNQVTSMADLFGNYSIPTKKSKSTSERSELVQYFYENALRHWEGNNKLTAGRVAYKLSHLSLQDLYAFRSQCEDRARRGYPWAKYFWGSLKAR